MSGDSSQFLAEVDKLERLKAEIAQLTRRTDGDHRQQVVQVRRQIAAQLFAVGTAGERLFARSPDLATFRTKYSALRSATAAHQAEWPAVLLRERRDAFLASTEPMRVVGRDFFAWARSAVSRL